jgi:hypothetical protein
MNVRFAHSLFKNTGICDIFSVKMKNENSGCGLPEGQTFGMLHQELG